MVFFRFKRIADKYKGNKNTTIEEYFSKIKSPSMNRSNHSKYYIEMQLLAFQLSRYLDMNGAEGEHSNQGNWNWTYFRENLTEEGFQRLANYVLGDMNQVQWEKAIQRWKSLSRDREYWESLVEEDIGDSYFRITYKPIGSEEIKRIVKKRDLKEAVSEIGGRVELEYLRTEVVEYKE